MITKEKFCKNMNLLHLAYVCNDENMIKRIMNGILAHFPKEKEELEHYCHFLCFGKCGDDFEPSEDFYERLIKNTL